MSLYSSYELRAESSLTTYEHKGVELMGPHTHLRATSSASGIAICNPIGIQLTCLQQPGGVSQVSIMLEHMLLSHTLHVTLSSVEGPRCDTWASSICTQRRRVELGSQKWVQSCPVDTAVRLSTGASSPSVVRARSQA